MKTIDKVIKDAVAANKYKSGVKEVLQSAKSSKLVIVSKSLDAGDRAKLDEQAKSAGVAIYEFDGNSVQLGKLCNKPFRITAIAIKGATDAEVKAVMADEEKKGK
ncbi:ribosomal protein L30E [Candidatus Nitrososphaera evergladensis SR1]|jgi:large subunit ribosomal protein L30e|uniref:Ribosomal protein L30E n=1 Tax=Candidatus Nitrososphaera evergladensis SR1 TaxID=1459636 RepID=A0A075MUC5_9ARCH|nr:ribosomal L7Ae/L30e/S12e/Gadd45 family protein [Candidatus Nitrososphaera evergladensis]AIF84790.1 ribosomal protein L30E [Candidatus Nitrososphaera evergladensis SR1]